MTELIDSAAATCPYPEWPLVQHVARRWRDIVSQAGGTIGDEILRQPVLNPYEGYSGLPVIGRTFIGRREILGNIETKWAVSDLLPPIILYGHRRMGKTSILRNLGRGADSHIILVYLNMQDSGLVDHTGQLLLDMAEALQREAARVGLQAGPSSREADYATLGTARRALNALLDHLDPQMRQMRLILAVDEFELIEAGIREGRLDAGVPAYLRALSQNYRWLALIFAGLHTLDEMGHQYQSAFYGQAEHIKVGYLPYADAMRLITRPHPDFTLEYAPNLRAELYRLSYGQPYLLQRLCWEMVNHWNVRFLQAGEKTPRELTLADLAPLLTPDFYHAAGYYFDGVWSNITADERDVLRVLAEQEEGCSISDLTTATGKRG
ncbi:AAA family ATPase [Candidatus Amarolinea dominans]|uniref:AAA family ATPase n=1 Tax=Candidatus Amarolinea dominans TaxID=3140696 RepID=UPI0031369367|nr:ATP-binding protein [Anaerolineae bacterium]